MILINYFARYRDHIFTAHLFRFRVGCGRIFGIQHDLGHTITITQVEKRKFTKVAAARHPAHQRYCSPDIGGAQGAA